MQHEIRIQLRDARGDRRERPDGRVAARLERVVRLLHPAAGVGDDRDALRLGLRQRQRARGDTHVLGVRGQRGFADGHGEARRLRIGGVARGRALRGGAGGDAQRHSGDLAVGVQLRTDGGRGLARCRRRRRVVRDHAGDRLVRVADLDPRGLHVDRGARRVGGHIDVFHGCERCD
ncbi:hypothetical protein, partial [Burkholderia pseudomallei]